MSAYSKEGRGGVGRKREGRRSDTPAEAMIASSVYRKGPFMTYTAPPPRRSVPLRPQFIHDLHSHTHSHTHTHTRTHKHINSGSLRYLHEHHLILGPMKCRSALIMESEANSQSDSRLPGHYNPDVEAIRLTEYPHMSNGQSWTWRLTGETTSRQPC